MGQEKPVTEDRRPMTTRPEMPGYGVPEDVAGALPWEWARERLERCRNYFVATTRADGRPHVMPVWGVWLDEAFVFSTGALSRKAKNLAREPRCVVTIEGADEAVIVEGLAHEEHDENVLAKFRAAYRPKYDFDMDFTEGIYTVVPQRVFGFIEAEDQFGRTATRWLFENDE